MAGRHEQGLQAPLLLSLVQEAWRFPSCTAGQQRSPHIQRAGRGAASPRL